MAVILAKDAHFNEIEELLLVGRHVYAQPAFDLATALRQHTCAIGIHKGQISAFACAEREVRPSTLSFTAPSRAYLSCVAVASGHSPYNDLPLLIDVLTSALMSRQMQWQQGQNTPQEQTSSILLIHHGHKHWIIKPLQQAGFEINERVEALILDRLQRRKLPSVQEAQSSIGIRIRLAQRADMDAIAELDAQSFTPLWHLGVEQLVELWANDHRFCVACEGDLIIGYSALTQIVENGYSQPRYAHLSRIATAMDFRKRGVGKALLVDVLHFAKQQGLGMVTLNTQTDNASSHALYRSMGFAKSGHIYPILTRLIAPIG